MNTPIRIRTYKIEKEGTRTFSFILWVNMVLRNLKHLFTKEVMTSGEVYYVVNGRELKTITDFSLMVNDDRIEFVNTPSGLMEEALLIEQRVE